MLSACLSACTKASIASTTTKYLEVLFILYVCLYVLTRVSRVGLQPNLISPP